MDVLPVRYVTLSRFEGLTGYTQKAARRKIEDGVWIEGFELAAQGFRGNNGVIECGIAPHQPPVRPVFASGFASADSRFAPARTVRGGRVQSLCGR